MFQNYIFWNQYGEVLGMLFQECEDDNEVEENENEDQIYEIIHDLYRNYGEKTAHISYDDFLVEELNFEVKKFYSLF